MKRERQRGTGSIYKQKTSDVWWLKYYRHGRQLRESSGTTNEAEAEKLLKKRVAQVTSGTHPGLEIERIKVDELAEDFLRDYRIKGHKTLDDVQARWSAAPCAILQRHEGRKCYQQAPGAIR